MALAKTGNRPILSLDVPDIYTVGRLRPPPKTNGPSVSGNGQELRAIFGSKDGRILAIDTSGNYIFSPAGPGDPKVKKAVASIEKANLVIARAAAALVRATRSRGKGK